MSTFRVAVTQHEPVWLDLDGAVAKTITIVKEAAQGGAKLVTFPECWIPGYPAWIWSRPVDFDLGVAYVNNSLSVSSPQFRQIQSAAAENKIAISLCFSERDGDSVYIAQALIDSNGQLAMRRRKFKPTHMERTIFGDASGSCLANVVKLGAQGQVSIGRSDADETEASKAEGEHEKLPEARVGGLACWEHMQPLLKYYTFSQGEQIHVAAWPPLDGFIQGSPGLWTMSIEGCLNLSQTYAAESQSFVLHCTTVISEAGITAMTTAGSPIMGTAIKGSSAVIGPDGRVLSAADSPNEQLIFADLDLSLVVKAKTFADASGHYSRPDMLWLGADPTTKPVVRVANAAI